MKNLKLVVVLAVAMLSTTLIKAQTTPLVQAKFGMSTFSSDPKTDGLSGSFAFGIGAGIEKAFSDNFYFQPSVNYNYRGVSIENSYSDPAAGVSTKFEEKWNIGSLEVPLYFLYKTGDPSANSRFFFGFGPSLGLRMGGKRSGSTSLNGTTLRTWDEKMHYGTDTASDFKNFVFGLGVQAGMEFSNAFQIGLEWNTDLNDASTATGVTARTGLFGLRFALLLGGRDY